MGLGSLATGKMLGGGLLVVEIGGGRQERVEGRI